jgi:hypothetical protein
VTKSLLIGQKPTKGEDNYFQDVVAYLTGVIAYISIAVTYILSIGFVEIKKKICNAVNRKVKFLHCLTDHVPTIWDKADSKSKIFHKKK